MPANIQQPASPQPLRINGKTLLLLMAIGLVLVLVLVYRPIVALKRGGADALKIKRPDAPATTDAAPR